MNLPLTIHRDSKDNYFKSAGNNGEVWA